MVDAVGALGEPQQQLEVLDRVEGGVEPPGIVDQLAPDHQQMPDVHRAEGVDGRPVRLQERIGPASAGGQLVLVGVDDVGVAAR